MPLVSFLLLGSLATAAEPAVPVAAEAATPLTVGASAPVAVTMRTPAGTVTTLEAVHAGQPTAVIFYRGGWCPYCTRHLAGLGPALEAAQASG